MNKFELKIESIIVSIDFLSGYLVALATKLYLDHMLFKVCKMFLK